MHLKAALAPVGARRMGANPHANGGLLLRDLQLPDYRTYAAHVPVPGEQTDEIMAEMGFDDTRISELRAAGAIR